MTKARALRVIRKVRMSLFGPGSCRGEVGVLNAWTWTQIIKKKKKIHWPVCCVCAVTDMEG